MRTLKTLLVISVLSFLIIEPASSQEAENQVETPQKENITHPNIVKVNSLALIFKNVSLIYERGIIPRVSAGIGVGYKYAGAEPKLLTIDDSVIKLDIDKIQGFSITPTGRYYIRACDPQKLDGFYVGLYLRYTNYKTKANFDYLPDESDEIKYSSDIGLSEYGVGFELGYQMLIKERFSLDFLFIGPRYSNFTMTYEFNEQPTQEFFDDLSESINDVVDRLGFDYDVDIHQKGEANADASFSFANVRFGLSLGYAF